MTNLIDENVVQKILENLMDLEEDRVIIGFHQNVQKAQKKSWHDRRTKEKSFSQGTQYYYMIENM